MSVDAFEVLGLPRRAALAEEEIRSAYFSRTKTASGEQETLNSAFQTLSAPEKRLKHLMDLAAPPEAKVWRAVVMPEELMNLFSKVGGLKAECEHLLKRRASAGSALARALLETQVLKLREAAEETASQLASELERLQVSLPQLDLAVQEGAADAWHDVAACQAHFAYLAKWQTQVRELLLGLM